MTNKLRELEQAATPAPWEIEGERSLVRLGEGGVRYLTTLPTSVDAAFIAAFRNRAPLLLDVVDAARVLTAGSADPQEHWDDFWRLQRAVAALDAKE